MTSVLVLLALAVSAANAQGQGVAVPGAAAAVATAPAAATLHVAFKLDPRLTTGLYMGARWVSPATYSTSEVGKSVTVDARVSGVDARGRPAKISPRWAVADPAMVTVTPGEGNLVKITVQRPGESLLRVTSHDLDKSLAVKAVRQGEVLRVEIAQK